ncbi:MAG: MATE family efflux transporter [Candidatus Faecivicinus sp.]|nr:MATE family efflux transporter [Candidatus Faecivicinus sp.]
MIRDREFYKTIFRISLPAAFQALVSFLVVVADDVMVSKLPDGASAQAAVTQVNSLTAFYTATLTGLVSGSAVLIAQYWGKRDMERIRRVFSIVFWICALVAVVFTGVARLFPGAVTGLVISAKETQVSSLARDYLRIACLTFLPYAITTALIGMLRSIEVVKITLVTTVVALFLNIGLNALLIFGLLGFPRLGVIGAAVATLITRIVEMIMVVVYTFCIQKQLAIRPKNLFEIDRALAHDYARYGLPVGLTDMQWSLIGILKSAIIGQMGVAFMAANSIASSMANLGTMFTFALAGGACVVVGKAVGKGDYAAAREYSKTIQLLFLMIGVTMAGLVFALRTPFTRLYGSSQDPEVYSLATTMIAILAVTLIGTSYHASCFLGINRGAGDSRFVAMVDSICGWLIVLPATALSAFVFKAPLPVVFLATRIDQCFKWIIAMLRLRGDKWIQNVTREETLPQK